MRDATALDAPPTRSAGGGICHSRDRGRGHSRGAERLPGPHAGPPAPISLKRKGLGLLARSGVAVQARHGSTISTLLADEAERHQSTAARSTGALPVRDVPTPAATLSADYFASPRRGACPCRSRRLARWPHRYRPRGSWPRSKTDMSDATARLARAGAGAKGAVPQRGCLRGEVLFQPCVATISVDDSPSCAREYWTVRDQPIGARAVQPRSPAVWTDVGWLIAPSLGMIVWSAVNGPFGRFDGSGWSCGDAVAWRLIVGVLVVGVQQLPIRHPSGGVIIDGAARAAISTILAAPRSHGLIAPEIICGDAKPNLGKRVRLAPAGKRHDEVDQVWLFGNREGICVLARIFLFG